MKTILVIDDNQDFREMLDYILSNEGYKVLVASDGKQGIAQARQERPDLILMDIMMPEHDGTEIAKYLRTIDKLASIPVVFLTGIVSNDHPEGGNVITINGHDFPMIPKIIDQSELLRRLNKFILKGDSNALRVLIIEDSPTDAHFIARSLEKSKRRAIEMNKATSLQSAEKCLKESPFDLMILDLGLPDSKKKDTLLWMLNQELPIVVITGDDDDATVGEAFRHGAQDYLVKGSFTDKEIIRCVLYAVERSVFKKELQFYKYNTERIIQDRLKEHLKMDKSVNPFN